MKYDLLVIGAGTAGLSAAMYGVRAGLKTICIEDAVYGGQIVNTPEIVNYPGIPTITGIEFANQLYQQATSLGAQVFYEQIDGLDFGLFPKRVHTTRCEYQADAVIIANGARHRKLGCAGEDAFEGKGVSYCAACDGNFFKSQVVCVVGGGNTALEDALYLSRICREVHLIHRRDTFRASAAVVEQVRQTQNILLHLSCTVSEILGESTVNAIRIADAVGDAGEETIPASGVFIAVGLQPNNTIFDRWVDLDSGGYIVAGEDCKTKTEGLFAAGDTRTKQVRQLVTAAADGAIAATGASQYLYSKNSKK